MPNVPPGQPPSETSPGAHSGALGEDAEPVLGEGGEGQLFLELEPDSSMCTSQGSLPVLSTAALDDLSVAI